jgi:hypothetical protein
MIVDDDIFDNDDTFREHLKEFVSQEEVNGSAAAKQLMIHIERAVCEIPSLQSFTLSPAMYSNEVTISRLPRARQVLTHPRQSFLRHQSPS